MVTKAKAKAKPSAKARGKPKSKTAARPRKALSVAGPITLEEARALARARQPKRALRRTPSGPPATAATVGAERERLEEQRRAERERRIREYKATMEIMKQFAAMLTTLATRPKVVFINGQGTLASSTSARHNELHPGKDGFEKFADLFHQQLRATFPGRVL